MASVDPRELLSHASWLRQLARSLVTEGADDLVQDTWVAALRRPPDNAGSARPWLRTVLKNAARMRWRGDANRIAREDAAGALDDREVPSAETLLERHELQQLLARLVSELDEPFRSTVLLRFAEGLTPTQIAGRLEIPAGTVRWRLSAARNRSHARTAVSNGEVPDALLPKISRFEKLSKHDSASNDSDEHGWYMLEDYRPRWLTLSEFARVAQMHQIALVLAG